MNVLIVGATSAIAQAIAREFARREHARYFLLGRDAGKLAAVAADLRVRGAAQAELWAVELTDPETALAACARAETALAGPVDLVLIAHGALTDECRAAAEPAYAAEQMRLNLLSPVWFANAAAAYFRAGKRGGGIALITSVAGERGRASNFFYGASKAALSVFLSGLRASLWRDGVAVTELRPGFIDTPMTAHVRKGPLFCSAERAGELCAAAIRARRAVAYIPGFWRWIMLLVRAIPERVFVRLKF